MLPWELVVKWRHVASYPALPPTPSRLWGDGKKEIWPLVVTVSGWDCSPFLSYVILKAGATSALSLLTGPRSVLNVALPPFE